MKRYTITFNCCQYGASCPDIKQTALELTPQVRRSIRHQDTYTVTIWDKDEQVYFFGSSVEKFEQILANIKYPQICDYRSKRKAATA